MAFSLYILLVLALHVVDCVLGGVLVDARMRMTAQVGGRENGSRGSGDPFLLPALIHARASSRETWVVGQSDFHKAVRYFEFWES